MPSVVLDLEAMSPFDLARVGCNGSRVAPAELKATDAALVLGVPILLMVKAVRDRVDDLMPPGERLGA